MTNQDQLIEAWKQTHGDSTVLDRQEVFKVADDAGIKRPNYNFMCKLKVSRNQFSIANYGQVAVMPHQKWGDL